VNIPLGIEKRWDLETSTCLSIGKDFVININPLVSVDVK
jgi:hypothetical protein